MRVLLDSCVPKQLGKQLPEHEVRTAPEMGWGDFDDGPLLDAMAGRFDALITVDKSLPKQQNLSTRLFGVVLLRARSNRLADLIPLVPDLIETLKNLGPGETRELGV